MGLGLTGKTVLSTGTSKGTGLACAQSFAKLTSGGGKRPRRASTPGQ